MRALAATGMGMVIAAASGCGQESAEPGGGGAAPGVPLIVEVLHAGLIGPVTAASRDRVPALLAQLAASPADVVCLQGVWDADVRAGLAEGLRSVFPHVVDLRTGDGSTVDGIPGHAPLDPPTGPTCTPVLQNVTTRVTGCASSFGVPLGNGGVAAHPAVLAEGGPCAVLREELVRLDPDGRCTSCVLGQIASGAELDGIAALCTREGGDPLAFGGDSGVIVLSRAPVEQFDQRVLPSLWTRRVLVSARVAHAAGSLDVVCASLTPAAPSGLAADPSEDAAEAGSLASDWEAENALQVDALLAFVDGLGGARPAIILGNFGTSPSLVASGGQVLDGFGAAAEARMAERYALAADPRQPPACTVCPDNPLVLASARSSLMNRVYLAAPGAEVEAVGRVYLGRVAVIEDPTEERTFRHVPSVAQYGTRATLRLPAP